MLSADECQESGRAAQSFSHDVSQSTLADPAKIPIDIVSEATCQDSSAAVGTDVNLGRHTMILFEILFVGLH